MTDKIPGLVAEVLTLRSRLDEAVAQRDEAIQLCKKAIEIIHQLQKANADHVATALGLERLINQHLMRPPLGRRLVVEP